MVVPCTGNNCKAKSHTVNVFYIIIYSKLVDNLSLSLSLYILSVSYVQSPTSSASSSAFTSLRRLRIRSY